MNAKLDQKNGRTVFNINGELVEPTGIMTYNPHSGQLPKFREQGARIFFFGAYACDQGINNLAGLRPFTPSYFIGENRYDFSEIDRTLEDIAPGGTGAYIILRVYLSTPTWWEEKYPEELCRNRRGEAVRESFASQKWRDDMWGALKALIDHINGSKWKECVIGYHIASGSTEEWTYHGRELGMGDVDYSENNQKSFRNWLVEKYGSLDGINEAWNTNHPAMDTITIPAVHRRHWVLNGIIRDPGREMDVLDYYDYCAQLFIETIEWFCKKVKDYTDNTLLTGVFYGYILSNPRADRNHNDLYDLIRSPYVDFIATTHGHAPGWPYTTAKDSIHLHGKLFVSEGDIRTCLTQNPAVTLPHIVPDNRYYTRPGIWLGPDNVEDSVSNLMRTSARVLTGMNGIWWFDMFGGWFDHPKMMEVIQKHDELASEQTVEPLKPEVALIIDEDGLKFFPKGLKTAWYACDGQRQEFSLCGTPHHVYLADDIAEDNFPVEDYKCYVFVQFCYPKEHIVRAINEKLKGGGRTLFWTHFAGLENRELTDFSVTYDAFEPEMQCEVPDLRFPTYRSAYEQTANETPYYPPKKASCPRFGEEEKYQSYVLANFKDTNEPALLWKQFDDYASVYSLLPCIPHQILSVIISMSNAHIYCRTGDAFMAGGNYVAIRAVTTGEKRIHFPFPVSKVMDAYTGEEMVINDLYIDFEMEEKETRIFRITKK